MNNEIKVGITVLLAAIAAVLGFRFMSDMPVFGVTQELHTTFDRVDGLSVGSMIYIRGVKAGSVSGIQLNEENNVDVRLRLDIRRELPRGSQALLTSIGIIEGRAVVIELGSSDETIPFGSHIEGRYVESMVETLGSRSEELGDDLSESLTQLNRFLASLNETFQEETQESIGQTVNNVAAATGEVASILEGKRDEIDLAITSGQRMLAQLDTLSTEARPSIERTMASIEEHLAELEKTRLELESATTHFNEILGKINSGEGTIGKLINDPAMYDNLEELSKELSELVKGINENPGRYLRHMSIIEIF
ncbi:MAG: MlaD family protein [Balneolaceae bacterium]